MKTLFLLILISSCGKNINHTKRDFIVREPLKLKESLQLPETLSFKTTHHQVSLHSKRELSFSFFEGSPALTQYYSYDLTHIHPDTVYQLETVIPEETELYIHDLGKDLLVDPQNLKFHHEFQERLNQNKSFFFIALKPESERSSDIVVKNHTDHKTILLASSLEAYLEQHNIKPKLLDLTSLIEGQGDNDHQWWIKRGALGQYHLVHGHLNDIKDQFLKHYQYQKQTVKRVNGEAQTFNLLPGSFIKVSAHQTLQKLSLRRFEKTYFTMVGELPYTCRFTEAKVVPLAKRALSAQELQQLFDQKNPKSLQHNSWTYHGARPFKLALPSSKKGQLEIGLIERKCPTKMGPKINKQRVNTEKELELVIESYRRKE